MSSPHIVRDGECDGIKWSVRYEPAFCGYFYFAVLGNYEYTCLKESCSEFQLKVFLDQARIVFKKFQRKDDERIEFSRKCREESIERNLPYLQYSWLSPTNQWEVVLMRGENELLRFRDKDMRNCKKYIKANAPKMLELESTNDKPA